jgi:superfamily I DNA/RNA helicase
MNSYKYTLLLLSLSLGPWAGSISAQPVLERTAADSSLFERELIEREIANRMAVVRNKAELASYLASAPKNSPLMLLSKGARQRFLQSLIFTDRGLASFQYSELRSELNASQIYRLLSIFGAQNSTKSIPGLRVESETDAAVYDQVTGLLQPAVDYPDRMCVTPATCRKSIDDICIGNNCGVVPRPQD